MHVKSYSSGCSEWEGWWETHDTCVRFQCGWDCYVMCSDFFPQQQTSYCFLYLWCLLNITWVCKLIGLNGPSPHQWIHSLVILVSECRVRRWGLSWDISLKARHGKVFLFADPAIFPSIHTAMTQVPFSSPFYFANLFGLWSNRWDSELVGQYKFLWVCLVHISVKG